MGLFTRATRHWSSAPPPHRDATRREGRMAVGGGGGEHMAPLRDAERDPGRYICTLKYLNRDCYQTQGVTAVTCEK